MKETFIERWCLSLFTKTCLLKGLAHDKIILVLYPACSKFIQSSGLTIIGKVIARFLLGEAKCHFPEKHEGYKMADTALYVVIHYHLFWETDLSIHRCKENPSFPMIHYKSLLVSLPWKTQSIPQEALLCPPKYKSFFTLNCKPNLPRKCKQLNILQKSKVTYIPFDNISNHSCDCRVGWLLLSFSILD